MDPSRAQPIIEDNVDDYDPQQSTNGSGQPHNVIVEDTVDNDAEQHQSDQVSIDDLKPIHEAVAVSDDSIPIDPLTGKKLPPKIDPMTGRIVHAKTDRSTVIQRILDEEDEAQQDRDLKLSDEYEEVVDEEIVVVTDRNDIEDALAQAIVTPLKTPYVKPHRKVDDDISERSRKILESQKRLREDQRQRVGLGQVQSSVEYRQNQTNYPNQLSSKSQFGNSTNPFTGSSAVHSIEDPNQRQNHTQQPNELPKNFFNVPVDNPIDPAVRKLFEPNFETGQQQQRTMPKINLETPIMDHRNGFFEDRERYDRQMRQSAQRLFDQQDGSPQTNYQQPPPSNNLPRIVPNIPSTNTSGLGFDSVGEHINPENHLQKMIEKCVSEIINKQQSPTCCPCVTKSQSHLDSSTVQSQLQFVQAPQQVQFVQAAQPIQYVQPPQPAQYLQQPQYQYVQAPIQQPQVQYIQAPYQQQPQIQIVQAPVQQPQIQFLQAPQQQAQFQYLQVPSQPQMNFVQGLQGQPNTIFVMRQ